MSALKNIVMGNRILSSLVKAALKFAGRLTQQQACRAYVQSHEVRKLQIGCHNHLLAGWLNTDICPQKPGVVYMDATRRFPFPDSTFDYIFSEHQLEHISFAHGTFMLSECMRVLKPGGKMRIVVPSLDFLLQLYKDPSSLEQSYIAQVVSQNFPQAPACLPSFPLNLAFTNWGHLFMYDLETLKLVLLQAGFKDVTFPRVGRSQDPSLTGIDFRRGEFEQFKNLVAEGTKPFASDSHAQLKDLERTGFEPVASSMPLKRATNCANAPR